MRWVLRWILNLSAGCVLEAEAGTYTVTVDAREHSLRDHRVVPIGLPSGAVSLNIQTTGWAEYEAGRSFAALLLEHKDGAASMYREVPIGEEVSVHIAETLAYPLQFFFVDSNPSDNAGLVQVAVSGSISVAITVSPVQHCIVDSLAARIPGDRRPV
jgi:hypothetical protein